MCGKSPKLSVKRGFLCPALWGIVAIERMVTIHDKKKNHRLNGMCGVGDHRQHPAADGNGSDPNPMGGKRKSGGTGYRDNPIQRIVAEKAKHTFRPNAGTNPISEAPLH